MPENKTGSAVRAKYEKPVVKTYQVYEQTTLGCAKANASFACRRVSKNS